MSRNEFLFGCLFILNWWALLTYYVPITTTPMEKTMTDTHQTIENQPSENQHYSRHYSRVFEPRESTHAYTKDAQLEAAAVAAEIRALKTENPQTSGE